MRKIEENIRHGEKEGLDEKNFKLKFKYIKMAMKRQSKRISRSSNWRRQRQEHFFNLNISDYFSKHDLFSVMKPFPNSIRLGFA